MPNRPRQSPPEEALRLVRRCARIAVRAHPLRERLNRVGNLWAAADQARLGAEARAARQEYTELRGRLQRLQRAYRAIWRTLRRLQRDWDEEQWERYRELVDAHLEALAEETEGSTEGRGAALPHALRQILEASARPARPMRLALLESARRWCAQLWLRLRRRKSA